MEATVAKVVAEPMSCFHCCGPCPESPLREAGEGLF